MIGFTKQLLNVVRESKQKVNLWYRTAHYIPLNCMNSGTCPPLDYRNPILLDGYSNVVIDIGKKFNISVIDTRYFLRPVWDTASDWNHLHKKVRTEETSYILGIIIKNAFKS